MDGTIVVFVCGCVDGLIGLFAALGQGTGALSRAYAKETSDEWKTPGLGRGCWLSYRFPSVVGLSYIVGIQAIVPRTKPVFTLWHVCLHKSFRASEKYFRHLFSLTASFPSILFTFNFMPGNSYVRGVFYWDKAVTIVLLYLVHDIQVHVN